MEKERKKGTHQIVILAHLMGKTEELSLLTNATMRRLEELSNSE